MRTAHPRSDSSFQKPSEDSASPNHESQQQAGRIECLDGLRGIAAIWVLVGHTMLLTGFRIPIISSPGLGVDLFIMLSGFLMVYHYKIRERKEPWDETSTWRSFWIRRFFRIAPLYYIALLVALAAGPQLFEAREEIAKLMPDRAQNPARFTDQSAANYVMHLSFLFGLHPGYAYRTPLPDWSIGLEMQFYAAFPFLMMFWRRLGSIRGILTIGLIGSVTGYFIGKVLPFPMPSFLLLKLHIFAAGMLTAHAFVASTKNFFPFILVLILLVLIPLGGEQNLLHLIGRACIALGFFALVNHRDNPRLSRFMSPISKFLGNKFFHWLGELSYGSYLVHLLVLTPVTAWLVSNYGEEIDPSVRFVVALVVTICITYPIAAVGYKFIEMPGQRIGKVFFKGKNSVKG